MAEYHPAGAPTEEHFAEDNDGHKRKRSDNPGQQRAKRNRYISIACNECKRRKIKCNGETPCARCGNLGLECLYAPNCCTNNFRDTNEFKQMSANILSLQEQLDALYQNVTALRTALGQEVPQQDPFAYNNDSSRPMPAPQASMIDPALSRNKQTAPYQPRNQGAPHSAYSYDIARSSLQSMGITEGMEGSVGQDNRISAASDQEQLRLHPSAEALASISKEETMRLIGVYDQEISIMYPIIDVVKVTQYGTLVIGLGLAVKQTNQSVKSAGGMDFSGHEEMDILKLVLAIASAIEGGPQSDFGRRLFEVSFSGKEFQAQASLSSIQIMVLSTLYRFYSGDDCLSCRVVGTAARLCIELGLHRSETYKTLENDEERDRAVRLFWSVYVLDRCTSFEMGIPVTLPDSLLDPGLPRPDESCAFLAAMISYCRLQADASKVAVASESSSKFDPTESSRISDDATRWYESIPHSLRYTHPSSPEYSHYGNEMINAKDGTALHRLRVVLYLRHNQLRIQAYRPVLHSTRLALAESSREYAQAVIDVAKDTIRILTHIHAVSDVYRTQPTSFSHFLVPALAILFLAVSHAPALFADPCREEFGMAVDLVRGLPGHSNAGKRLSRTVKGLKDVAPRLGLYAKAQAAAGPDGASQQQTQRDAHSSAAMGLAGLAGHRVDEHALLAAHGNGSRNGSAAADGAAEAVGFNGTAGDLAGLFEAAGKVGKAKGASGGKHRKASRADAQGADVASGGDEELGRIVSDLF